MQHNQEEEKLKELMTMKLKRLGQVAICLQDIDKAASFYQNLGMSLAWKDRDWAYHQSR